MSEFFRRERLKKIREESKVFEIGPPVQVSYILGLFGEYPEGITSPEVLKNLRLILSRFRLVTTETRGKFTDLGSGYWTALLGAEDPTEEDPLMAVTVALKMMKIASRSKKLPPLKIAVVTGPVSQKTLSTPPDIRSFLASGDTTGNPLIDRALKILSSQREPAVYVDSFTYQMVRDFHLCQRVAELPSAPSPLEVYRVQSSSQNPQFAKEPKLIDRLEEIQKMRELFAAAERGDGPVFLTVTGELGIGKSRLVREFAKEVEKKSHLFRNPRERRRIDRWRRVPYSYFGEILRAFFKLDERNPKSLEEFLEIVGEIFPSSEEPPLLREQLEALAPLFLLDFISTSSISPEGEDPKEREKRVFAAFSRFLELAAATKPVVFILEDLYSADAPSIRLLQYLIRHLEVGESLFICVSRTDLLALLEEELGLKLPDEKIVLKPLDRESSRQLIRELLPRDLTLPEKLCEQILDLSEGNPFFLREVIRHLAEKEIFDKLESGEEISRLDIPQNIEGILLSRLSTLSEEERDVLYKAAIFGKNFWRGAVESLYRQESELPQGWQLQDGVFSSREDDLESILDTLVHKGIVQRVEPSEFPDETQYTFSPGFLQELIYQEIPETLRGPYHFLAAQWLELAAHRNRRELKLEIVHHLDSAKQYSLAAPYHIDIGIKYFRTFDIINAIQHLEQGLSHLDSEKIVKLTSGLKVLAESYIVNAQYDKAIETFEKLLNLSWKMGQRSLGGDIYLRIGWVHFLKRDFKKALSSMKNGHTLHRQAQNRRGIAMALSNMGQVYTMLGDFGRAEPLLKEALEIRRKLQLPGDLAWALNNMANLLMHKGQLDEALKLHREALEIRKKLNNPFLIIRSRNNIALIYMLKGDYDSALAELLPSSALAKRLGEKLGMAIIMVNIAELYLLKGEFNQAEEAIQQALQYSQKLQDPLLLSECYRLQSELALERQSEEEALQSAIKSFELVNEHDIKPNLIPLYRVLGDIFASAEEREIQLPKPASLPFEERFFADPIACYEESIALAHQYGNQPEEAKSRMMLGIYEVNSGNIARGRYQLQLAQNAFSKLGMFRELEEVTAMLEEIDLFQGRTDRAKEKALRPPRSKLASVDKTIIQQFSYSPEEMALLSRKGDPSAQLPFPPPPPPIGMEAPPTEESKTQETLPPPMPIPTEEAGPTPPDGQIPPTSLGSSVLSAPGISSGTGHQSTSPDISSVSPGGQLPSEGTVPPGGQLPSEGSVPPGGQLPTGGSVPPGGQLPSEGTVPPGGQLPTGGTVPPGGELQPEGSVPGGSSLSANSGRGGGLPPSVSPVGVESSEGTPNSPAVSVANSEGPILSDSSPGSGSPLLPPAKERLSLADGAGAGRPRRKRVHTLELTPFQFSIGEVSSPQSHTLSQTPAVSEGGVSDVGKVQGSGAVGGGESGVSEGSSGSGEVAGGAVDEGPQQTLKVQVPSEFRNLGGDGAYSLPLASSDDEDTPTAVSTYVITSAEEFEELKGEDLADDATISLTQEELVEVDEEETIDLMKDEIFLETIDVVEGEDTDPGKRVKFDTEESAGIKGGGGSEGGTPPNSGGRGSSPPPISRSGGGSSGPSSVPKGGKGVLPPLPPLDGKVPFPPPPPGLPPLPKLSVNSEGRNSASERKKGGRESEEKGGGSSKK